MAKSATFSEKYPHIAWWVECHGTLEIGECYESSSSIRLLDDGGTCWQDDCALDEGLDKAEAFLITDLPDRLGEDFSLDD